MKTAVIGKAMPSEGVARLVRAGYSVLVLPSHPHLNGPVADHPDTLLFSHANTLIISAAYADVARDILLTLQKQQDIHLLIDPVDLSSPYPQDVRLNAKVVGHCLFGRLPSLSDTLLSYAGRAGLSLCDTAQGYAACTALAFDGYLVSSDPSMLATAQKNGIKGLAIREGGILLPPDPYGFIGGATAVTEDTVYTCGDLLSHPDGERIKNLLSATGRRIFPLFEGPLLDVGGILFFE